MNGFVSFTTCLSTRVMCSYSNLFFLYCMQYANPYDAPMLSDWIMDAQTEYGATGTFGSQAHSPEVVNSTSLRHVCIRPSHLSNVVLEFK